MRRGRKREEKKEIDFTHYFNAICNTTKVCNELYVKHNKMPFLSPSENIQTKSNLYSPSKQSEHSSFLKKLVKKKSGIHSNEKRKAPDMVTFLPKEGCNSHRCKEIPDSDELLVTIREIHPME